MNANPLKGIFVLLAVMVGMVVALAAIDHFRESAPMPAHTPVAAATKCWAAESAPRVVRAESPMYPDSVAVLHLPSKTVYVAVTIDASGRLARATVLQSSGNGALDAAALDAARRSSFAPGTRKCVPVTRRAAMRFIFNS